VNIDMKAGQKVKATPHPTGFGLVRALRNNSYGVESALGELVDNALDAGAHNVHVHMIKNQTENGYIDAITCTDDGSGMDADILMRSFSLGFLRKYGAKETGRYGMGGTNGPIGLGKIKMTLTRSEEGGTLIARKLDVDWCEANDMYGTFVLPLDQVKEEYINLFNDKNGNGTGTMIIIEALDKYVEKTVKNEAKRLAIYFGKTYFAFIEGGQLKLAINDKEVSPIDPLYWSHKDVSRVIDKQKILIGTNHDGEPIFCSVRVADLSNVNDARGSKQGRNMSDSQGVYFIRTSRMIAEAKTNDSACGIEGLWNKHPSYRNVRVTVKFESDADELFGVTFKKDDIRLDPTVAAILAKIINPAAKDISARTNAAKGKASAESKQNSLSDLTKKINSEPMKKIRKKSSEENNKTSQSTSSDNVVPISREKLHKTLPVEQVEQVESEYSIEIESIGSMNSIARSVGYKIYLNSDHPWMMEHYNDASDSTVMAIQSLLAVMQKTAIELGQWDQDFMNKAIETLLKNYSDNLARMTRLAANRRLA